MTLKDFVATLTKEMQDDARLEDYEVVMVAYDENGRRKLDIPVLDFTFAPDKKLARLWDC